MKKKILALVLCVAMLAIAIVGSTMAYFTDKDAATNIMTVGNVDIVQNEYERDGKGGLQPFTQNKKVLPAVLYNEEGKLIPAANWLTDYSYFNYTELVTTDSGATFYMPSSKTLRNAVDKIVTVTNEGDHDVWARTLIFVSDTQDEVYWNNLNFATDELCDRAWLYGKDRVELNGVYYFVIELVYQQEIKAGAESVPSFMAFYANPGMEQGTIGDAFEIVAISQAVQMEGFDDPHTALDAAFGEFNTANCTAWLDEIK